MHTSLFATSTTNVNKLTTLKSPAGLDHHFWSSPPNSFTMAGSCNGPQPRVAQISAKAGILVEGK